jgi:UDP-glucose 4-epimerase
MLARSPVLSGLVPPGVDVVLGDITDEQVLRAAVEGVDVVFHLAAKLHINSPSPALLGEYRRVNIEGTRILGRVAAEAGVRRLVFFSTIAVYGASHPGEVLTEDSATAPTSMYGTTKLEAEQVALELRARDGAPLAAVLRLAGVYGPRIKGNYRHLVLSMSRGWFVPVGDGSNRRTLIHEQDVAEAALVAAEHPAAAGRVFNVTDGSIHSFREIVEAIAHALGRQASAAAHALWPVRTLAYALDQRPSPDRTGSPRGCRSWRRSPRTWL